MRYLLSTHPRTASMVGMEVAGRSWPAGEVGISIDGLTARFAITTDATPPLTALWVSSLLAGADADAILTGLGLDERLGPDSAELAGEVDLPDDIEIPEPLRTRAIDRVTFELGRFRGLLDPATPVSGWLDVDQFPDPSPSAMHPVAREVEDGAAFPLLWLGVPDEVVRASSPWPVRVSRDERGRVVFEVAAPTDRRGFELTDLLVRVVDDRPDTVEPGDGPRVVALAALDAEGRAVIDHVELPPGVRYEVVDTSLRPILSRRDHQSAVAKQWGLAATAFQREGRSDLAEGWWNHARDGYAVAGDEDLRDAVDRILDRDF